MDKREELKNKTYITGKDVDKNNFKQYMNNVSHMIRKAQKK